MDFTEILRSERQTKANAFDWFIREYSKHPDGVFAFFEGPEDSSFYSGFLLHYVAPEKLHTRTCGGKDEVYRVHERVMRRQDRDTAIVLFFVDKDLSDILGEQRPSATNIYVTDYYSIENYLVSVDMLRRVWRELFRLTGKPVESTVEDFTPIETKFCDEQQRFYSHLRPVMAWVVCLKRKRLRPNVNNIELRRLYRFNESSMELELTPEASRQGIQHFLERAAYNGDPTPDDCQTDIDTIAQELSAMEPKCYIRGKFELWFFISFIHTLKETIRRTLQPGEKLTLSVDITENNALDVVGPRLSIPQSLQHFLNLNSMTRMASL